MNAFVCFLVFLMALFLMPSSSLAGGFFNNMLNNAVGSVVNKVGNSISQRIGSAPQASGQNASPTQQAPRQHQYGSRNGMPVETQESQATPNNNVAIKGAHYNEYEYNFSGKLKLQLSKFNSRSYKGWVISGGAPDYKVKSFHLDIGGLNSGWVLSNATTSSYWAWDRPEGNLRVHVTIATPGGGNGGAATINIFGTFIGNYTFSTSNNLTTAPVGPPLFDDKITMTTDGATFFAHYVKKTAAPIPSAYRGVSLDMLGIKPGMSLEAVKSILLSHYKLRPRSESEKLSLSYKTIIFLRSQPYVFKLDDQTKDNSDSIKVIFGNPAIGNTVIGIVRRLNFSENTAPKMSGLMAALNNKYGPSTVINVNNWASDGHKTWYFGKRSLIRSSSEGRCPTIDPVSNFDNYTPYSSGSNKTGSTPRKYACVEATFAPLLGDNSRVAWVTLTLYSLADTELSNKEAMKQMHTAVISDYKRVVKPEKVPKL